jgi:hypothetical protein
MTTAYQAMMTEKARTLSKMVEEIVNEGPVLPLTIGLKRVLTGEEIALPSEDAAEVERRFRSIQGELKASGELEQFFARRVASMTVRVERAVRLEAANLSDKVRHAAADFDASRVDAAAKLYDWIGSEPQANRRKLHETVEGVDRMIRAFRGLKDDLNRPTTVRWDWFHLEKVENLMGRRLGDLPISRAKALSEAIGGDFQHLEPSEGEGLDGFERQAWAREQMAELIDREIRRLEAHRTTFDLDEVDRARAESVDRVLFDASPEATLARKYEAAAERSLYRALGELRKLQARKAREPVESSILDEPELASFFQGESASEPARPTPPANPAPARPASPNHRPNGTRKPPRSRST